jgi:hypothetical protein
MADLAPRLFRLPSRPVVEYFHLKFRYPISEPNACCCGSRVLTGIRQRLLNNPIGRHFEGRRKKPRFAFDRQVHDELALASLGDQIAELGEARLGGELVRVTGAAKEPEEAMKVDHGPPTGVLN